MDQQANNGALEAVDWRLLNFFPEYEDMTELEKLLESRRRLVGELAQNTENDPAANRARLQRSLDAGNELTSKLAAYRRRLESELARANSVAQHRRALDEDLEG